MKQGMHLYCIKAQLVSMHPLQPMDLSALEFGLHLIALIEMQDVTQANEYIGELPANKQLSLLSHPFVFDMVIMSSNPHTLQILIESGVDIEQHVDNQTALVCVCASPIEAASLQCMQLLIEANADVNEFVTCTPISIAATDRNYDKCMLLMRNGADPFFSAIHECRRYTSGPIGETERNIWWTLHGPFFMAFAMGSHSRLGGNSGVRMLEYSLFPLIMQFVDPFDSFE